jgi:DNA-binding transcriptional ArsR family regulator
MHKRLTASVRSLRLSFKHRLEWDFKVGKVVKKGDVFAAIADPTRRRLMERLVSGEQSVADLTEGAGMTTAAVSLHLQVLWRAGLVSRRVVGRHRFYRLEPAPLRTVTDWAEALTVFWEEKLGWLEELAERMGAAADRSEI